MTNFLVNLLKVVLGLSVLTFIISIWILVPWPTNLFLGLFIIIMLCGFGIIYLRS